MPKFAPKFGDTIHTADGSEFICEAKPHDVKPHNVQLGYIGSTIYGKAGRSWQVWNDEGLPVRYDGTTNPHCSLRITSITSKDQDMPKFAPKFGDTIITKNGDRYTCIDKPRQYLAEYAPGAIFGLMSIPGGSEHMVWDSLGRPSSGLTVTYNSVHAIASVEIPGWNPLPVKAIEKCNPQPWDTLITAQRGNWTCCTQEFLETTHGLGYPSKGALYGFRPRPSDGSVVPVEWMMWHPSTESVVEGYEITGIIKAKCNRPAIRGRWSRDALINYIKTLPEQFGIDKDGNIE
jgi:hypothetical protein